MDATPVSRTLGADDGGGAAQDRHGARNGDAAHEVPRGRVGEQALPTRALSWTFAAAWSARRPPTTSSRGSREVAYGI